MLIGQPPEPVINCTPVMNILWVITSLPINLFFSGIFCYVAHKQYKLHGSDIWRRLSGDGIQTMCLVTLCNIVSGALVLLHAFGNFSQALFVLDW